MRPSPIDCDEERGDELWRAARSWLKPTLFAVRFMRI
jgi:hypothetical protein